MGEADHDGGPGWRWPAIGALRVVLPPVLEPAWRQHQTRVAALRFRTALLLWGGLWLLLALLAGLWLPAAGWALWRLPLLALALVLGAMAALAQWRALDRWYALYAGAGGALGLAVTLAATAALRDPACTELGQAVVIFAILSLYGLSGLRLSQALLAGGLGGLLGFALVPVLGGPLATGPCWHTFFASSLLGVVLAYYGDQRGKVFFMQLRQLDQLTQEDAVTGLPNRRRSDAMLRREWRRALRDQRPLALVLVHIDQIEPLCRTLGPEVANAVLRELADAVSRYARRPTDLAARVATGDFLLLLPDMLPDTADTVAEKLLEDIRCAESRAAPALALTASIGVAVAVPFSDWQPQWLLDAASRALREVQQAGGNGWRQGPFRVTALAGVVQ